MKKHIIKILSTAALTTFLASEIIVPLPLASISTDLIADESSEPTSTIEEEIKEDTNSTETNTETTPTDIVEDSEPLTNPETQNTETPITPESANTTEPTTSSESPITTPEENSKTEYIPVEAWEGNERLIEEVLNQTGIDDISKVSYDDISIIDSLNLSGNSSSLPAILGKFSGLKNLNLKGGSVSEIPAWMCNLTSLEFLNLECNHITNIPDSISNLTSLKELYLNMNKINSIPDSIFSISSLKTLGLFDNNLVSIPNSIINANGLNLNVSYNQIYSLPEAPNATIVCNHTFLPGDDAQQLTLINKWLNLNSNESITQDTLHSLVEASDPSHSTKPLDNRINLEFVIDNKIVSSDELASYDNGIYTASLKIQGTDLSNTNAITDTSLNINIRNSSEKDTGKVPYEAWEDCTPLMEFTCNYLKISDIKDVTYEDLSTIEYIELLNKDLNSLPSIVSKYTNVKAVNLVNNNFTEIPDELFSLKNLTDINMSKNNITSIPDGIGELSNLEMLTLELNDISSISSKIANLSNLKYICLNSNKKLQNCLETIYNINSLEILFMNNCNLYTLGENISNLTNLKTLQVCGNQLITPPTQGKEFTNYSDNLISLNDQTYKQLTLGGESTVPFKKDAIISQAFLRDLVFVSVNTGRKIEFESINPNHVLELIVDGKIVTAEELSKYPNGTYEAYLIIKGADINNTAAKTKDSITVNITGNDTITPSKPAENSNKTPNNNTKVKSSTSKSPKKSITKVKTSKNKIPYTGSEIAILLTLLGTLSIGSGVFIFKNKKNNKH